MIKTDHLATLLAFLMFGYLALTAQGVSFHAYLVVPFGVKADIVSARLQTSTGRATPEVESEERWPACAAQIIG